MIPWTKAISIHMGKKCLGAPFESLMYHEIVLIPMVVVALPRKKRKFAENDLEHNYFKKKSGRTCFFNLFEIVVLGRVRSAFYAAKFKKVKKTGDLTNS